MDIQLENHTNLASFLIDVPIDNVTIMDECMLCLLQGLQQKNQQHRI